MRLAACTVALALLAGACGDAAEAPAPAPPPAEPVALGPSGGLTRAEPPAGAPVAELVAGLNGAGFELLRSRPPDGNLVFSPASIGHALLMARPAADATTGAAIDEAFGLPAGVAAHEAWNAADRALAAGAGADPDVDLSLGARVWPAVDADPDQAWIDLLTAQHGAEVEALDFAGDPEAARQAINNWVADLTRGLIPELMPPGSIEPRTRLALTDAVYFAARWRTVFGKYQPEPGAFTRLDGSTVDVEFMRELEVGDRRGAGDGYVAAELPYAGDAFSMLLVVPDPGRFEEIRAGLDQAFVDRIDAALTDGPYELLMPQWTTHTQLDLQPWLAERGIAPGGYPGIAPDAFLGSAAHGADIAVDDWGTVAAAATGLAFPSSGPPEAELVVRADRPFLYLVRHRPTGLVLFAGQVTDPTAG